MGALAACTADELDRIFSLWRRVLTEQLARSESEVERLERAVDRVAERAAAARDRWDRERIDLVVLGASAGGIGPINVILRELVEDLPATVLLVLHIGEETPAAPATSTSQLQARHDQAAPHGACARWCSASIT